MEGLYQFKEISQLPVNGGVTCNEDVRAGMGLGAGQPLFRRSKECLFPPRFEPERKRKPLLLSDRPHHGHGGNHNGPDSSRQKRKGFTYDVSRFFSRV